MKFTKPSWVMHQDGTCSENANRLSTFSVHVHPDGSRMATGGLDAKIRVAGLQSDDEIIMIWNLKPTDSGKFLGSDEVNVAGGKPFNRLPGHESDVTDLAWAPEDRFLASTGLDSQVMIWCGYTL
ncbi:HIR1_5 [Sanghuangporus sanghuang]